MKEIQHVQQRFVIADLFQRVNLPNDILLKKISKSDIDKLKEKGKLKLSYGMFLSVKHQEIPVTKLQDSLKSCFRQIQFVSIDLKYVL